MTDKIIQEQIAYYRARANEYDEWFYRLGRYDRGEEFNFLAGLTRLLLSKARYINFKPQITS